MLLAIDFRFNRLERLLEERLGPLSPLSPQPPQPEQSIIISRPAQQEEEPKQQAITEDYPEKKSTVSSSNDDTTSLLFTTTHQRTMLTCRESPSCLSKAPFLVSQHARLLDSQHTSFLVSQLASLPRYIRYVRDMKATGKG